MILCPKKSKQILQEIIIRRTVLNFMTKNRDTRFLKSYTLNYTNTEGNEKLYEMVSNFDYEKPEEIGQKASGVVIVGFCGEKLLLLREFRMGVNQFIYNMPAGHLEEGESPEDCLVREVWRIDRRMCRAGVKRRNRTLHQKNL